jgi:uncharacterized protein YndB with AHSA1/START domain
MTTPFAIDPLRDLVCARWLEAPRGTVFDACCAPSLLARWWGPRGFTSTIHQLDVRPGGDWRITLHAPDGRAFALHYLVVEVVAPERLVLRHLSDAHPYELTITLEERGAGTQVTWRMRHESAELCARVRPVVAPANEENLDRLAEVLDGKS